MDDDLTVKQWIACHPEVWVPRFNILAVAGHTDKNGRHWPPNVMKDAAEKFVQRKDQTLGFIHGRRDPHQPAVLNDVAFLIQDAVLTERGVEVVIRPTQTIAGEIFRHMMGAGGISLSTSGIGSMTDGVIDYYAVESVVAYSTPTAPADPPLTWMLRDADGCCIERTDRGS